MSRKSQSPYQSGRVFFREEDFYDMVYNDEYISAVYTPESVEPAWRKYQRHLAIYGTSVVQPYGSYSPVDKIAVSWDIQNRFVSQIPDVFVVLGTANKEGYSIGGKFFTHIMEQASLDGYDWKSGDTPSFEFGFANDQYGCYLDYSGSDTVVKVVSLDWNEGETYFTTTEVNSITVSGYTSVVLQGSSPSGVYAQGRANGTYYIIDITPSGINVIGQMSFNGTGLGRAGGLSVQVYSYVSGSPRVWGVRAIVIDEAAGTANIVDIKASELTTSNVYPSVWWYCKGGEWFIYVLQRWGTSGSSAFYQKLLLYKTTDFNTITQVTLPDYIDIPIVQPDSSNGRVLSSNFQYIRAVLNNYDGESPPEVEGVLRTGQEESGIWVYDMPMGPVMRNQDVHEVINGIPTATPSIQSQNMLMEISNSDNGRTVGSTTYYGRDYFLIYIDNMEFQDSEENYAMLLPTKDSVIWGGDTLYYEKLNNNPITEEDYIFQQGGT